MKMGTKQIVINKEHAEINRENGTISFTVPHSVDDAWSLYTMHPLVQSVIDHELQTRQEHVHDVEPRSSHYAVKGILHELAGASFEIDCSVVSDNE